MRLRILGAFVIACAAVAFGWATRFQVVPASHPPLVYMVNRWTGTVYLVTPSGRRLIKDVSN